MGPDNDVIANVLYALVLYDRTRFTEIIQRGINYLEGQQEAKGGWKSTWYCGANYGTYMCLRLLATAAHESAAMQRGLHFLRHAQHADGGWGSNGESDPLNTAFSLLGLAAAHTCGENTEGDRAQARRAFCYLRNCQEADKGWPSCEFIRMKMGRTTGEAERVLTYGSRTLTTTCVLKALLAWDRLMTVAEVQDESKGSGFPSENDCMKKAQGNANSGETRWKEG